MIFFEALYGFDPVQTKKYLTINIIKAYINMVTETWLNSRVHNNELLYNRYVGWYNAEPLLK